MACLSSTQASAERVIAVTAELLCRSQHSFFYGGASIWRTPVFPAHEALTCSEPGIGLGIRVRDPRVYAYVSAGIPAEGARFVGPVEGASTQAQPELAHA